MYCTCIRLELRTWDWKLGTERELGTGLLWTLDLYRLVRTCIMPRAPSNKEGASLECLECLECPEGLEHE